MIRPPLPVGMTRTRLVAIMRGMETERCVDVATAAGEGGIKVYEVTMDSPNAGPTIAALVSNGHVVGAGTVLSIDDARTAVESGAEFLVAPNTDRRVVMWAVEHGHPVVPGAFTPTEVASAWELGSSAVKLFPASIGGPDLVRGITAALSHIPLMVTGGMDALNIGAYLSAGARSAGVGGWLVDVEDLQTIRDRAAALVAAVGSVDV